MLKCRTFPAGSFGWELLPSYLAADNKSMWEMRRVPQTQFTNIWDICPVDYGVARLDVMHILAVYFKIKLRMNLEAYLGVKLGIRLVVSL